MRQCKLRASFVSGWFPRGNSTRQDGGSESVEVEHRRNADKETAHAAEQVERDGRVYSILGGAIDEHITSDGGRYGKDGKGDQPEGRVLAKPSTAMTSPIESSAAPIAARPDMKKPASVP